MNNIIFIIWNKINSNFKPSGTHSSRRSRPRWCPVSWRQSPLGLSRASSSLRGSRATGRSGSSTSVNEKDYKLTLRLSSHDLFFSLFSFCCWLSSWHLMCLSDRGASSPRRTRWSHSSWCCRCVRGSPRPGCWAPPTHQLQPVTKYWNVVTGPDKIYRSQPFLPHWSLRCCLCHFPSKTSDYNKEGSVVFTWKISPSLAVHLEFLLLRMALNAILP